MSTAGGFKWERAVSPPQANDRAADQIRDRILDALTTISSPLDRSRAMRPPTVPRAAAAAGPFFTVSDTAKYPAYGHTVSECSTATFKCIESGSASGTHATCATRPTDPRPFSSVVGNHRQPAGEQGRVAQRAHVRAVGQVERGGEHRHFGLERLHGGQASLREEGRGR